MEIITERNFLRLFLISYSLFVQLFRIFSFLLIVLMVKEEPTLFLLFNFIIVIWILGNIILQILYFIFTG